MAELNGENPMPSADKRQERYDAAAHRQRILATARELFQARGVDAVSMHEIARTAKVGQGTLYRRFAHKGALCMALMADRIDAFCSEFETTVQTAGDHVPPLDLLALLLERLAVFNDEHTPLMNAVLDAAAGLRRGEAYASPFYRWLRALVVDLLERAAQRGELAPLDIECAVDMLLAPLAIDTYHYQRHVRGQSRERIVATLQALFLGGARPSKLL